MSTTHLVVCDYCRITAKMFHRNIVYGLTHRPPEGWGDATALGCDNLCPDCVEGLKEMIKELKNTGNVFGKKNTDNVWEKDGLRYFSGIDWGCDHWGEE